MKQHRLFILFYSVLFLIFAAPLFNFQQGLVIGDYGTQFYPWTLTYAKAIKNGFFPLWTPLIQSGFPLFAEGQTGMLYFFNLLFYKFLPFQAAYNLSFLFHLFLGGLFAYCFARRKGLSQAAGTLVALAFTFGSAGAGGFYNIVSLRTLCWFPLALYLTEEFVECGSRRALCILALVLGQTWLAGFSQLAAYQFIFVALYYGIRSRSSRSFSKHLLFLVALMTALLIGLPQVWATLQLAQNSTRSLYEPEFALWGSAAPWSLSLLFMVAWNGFMQASLYIGILPLMLLFLAPGARGAKLWGP